MTNELGPEQDSELGKWRQRIQERESVRKTFDEYDEAMKKIPAIADVYRNGERMREYRDHRLEWMIMADGIEVVRQEIKRANVRFRWPGNATWVDFLLWQSPLASTRKLSSREAYLEH